MIWISWENQRRSIELSRALGVEFFIIHYPRLFNKNKIFKYFILCLKTFFLIIQKQPKIIIVQNPSMILAAFACFFKILYGYKLIVDRHSNFRFLNKKLAKFDMLLLYYLSRFTIFKAELTIVTNKYLADYVTSLKGRPFVLEDKIPDLSKKRLIPLHGRKNIVFVCTYSDDEPIKDVLDAAFNNFPQDWTLYITGNYNEYKGIQEIIARLPKNIILTGFLSEEDYQCLLYSSDLIMVLTKNEYTLTCGAYEGVALTKPMVISNTITLKSYFDRGVIYTNPDAISIYNSITQAFDNIEILTSQIAELKNKLVMEWSFKFKILQKYIDENLNN